ncbi:MAG: signal peptidase I [Candidatus Omnitrophica bacterium]|nr:signal peptidase I [Candidatus Omnitrophota bacterium]
MKFKLPQISKLRTKFVRDWVEPFLVAAFLAFCIIRPLIVEIYKIPSGSMRPTLVEGDLIIVNKFLYGARIPLTFIRFPAFRRPLRGEVIVFKYPENPGKNFIKRLVGFPGEVVEIKDGTIYIDGRPMTEPPFGERYYYNRGRYGAEGEKIIVPNDSFFVLGDNSGSSLDSRFWGFVPYKYLQGKAMVIWWPINRIRIIK